MKLFNKTVPEIVSHLTIASIVTACFGVMMLFSVSLFAADPFRVEIKAAEYDSELPPLESYHLVLSAPKKKGP